MLAKLHATHLCGNDKFSLQYREPEGQGRDFVESTDLSFSFYHVFLRVSYTLIVFFFFYT